MAYPCISISKMYFSDWESQGVVGPESHGGQIPELTWLMQWPSDAPGSAGDKFAKTYKVWWEPGKQLEMQANSLGVHGIACDNPQRTSNHYRVVWNKWHILWECCRCARKLLLLHIVRSFLILIHLVWIRIYVSIYLYCYPSTHDIFGLAVNSAWAIGGVPEDGSWVNLAMYLEEINEVTLKMHIESKIE